MKNGLKITLTLSIVCLIAGLCLGAVYKQSRPSIEARQKADEEKRLKEIFPEADNFEEKSGNLPKIVEKYFLVKQKGKLLGYVFICSNYGYSSDIELMIGVDGKGNIAGVKVLSQSETPGLGTRIENPGFINQFKGWNYDSYQSGKVKFDSITGCTISSKAALNEIVSALDLWKSVK
ncbi:MAG: RnfABCDGE type electron transport complex subunit G [Candidatus Aureabacteria bacterium]|nr:RnfABCDGE type electron transport complex subunit G [Candidatus Auribacterota bacterium]